MKKNLKGCLEVIEAGESRVLLDMNQIDTVERSGLVPDRAHNRSAHMTARWQFGALSRAVFATGGLDLSAVRYLTFSVFALNAEGGSFSLMMDSSPRGEGKNGYEITLPLTRDGWNSYRVELPFMRAVGDPNGWDKIEAVCLDCVAGGQANRAETKLYLDNLYVWEGMAPPLYSTAPELKGAAVFSRTGSFTIIDRKRIANTPDGSVAKPFERGGVIWLPMAPVAAGIAHASVVDNRAATLSFTYRRKKYVFSGDRAVMTVDGVEQALPFTPAVVEGMLFFPADFVREFFRWRQMFVDPMGLVVLSNRKNIYESRRDESTILQLINDTTFLRPDSQRVLDDLHRNFPNPARGRLFASFDELMQLRRDVKAQPRLAQYVDRLKLRYGIGADAFVTAPVSSDASMKEKREAAQAIIAFAMLYRVTGDKKYAERTAAECEALCADYEHWGETADTAEIAFGIVIGYDWCRHAWSEGRKALIERALLRGAMRPAVDAYDGKGRMWRSGSALACSVNCTVLALCLALAEVYPQTAFKLLGKVLRNTEACFAPYAPDGGYPEGVAAWECSSRALTMLLSMLRRACGTDYGLGSAPGFAATARFPIYAETANGAWNYHNSAPVKTDTSHLFRLSEMYGDPVPAWMHCRDLLNGQKQVRPWDILFFTPVDDAKAPLLPLDAVYRRAGLAVMRAGWADTDAYVGLHGGRNHEIHADLDAGAILLEMGGVRFFEETGGYEELPMLTRRRAYGQNTLTVDPPADATLPDQNPEAVALLSEMRSSPARAYAVVDMTSISDAVLRGKRGAMLTENRRVAVFQDELTLSYPAEVVWSAWTRAAVKLNASGRVATLTRDGKTLAVRLCGVASPARFVTEAVEGTDWVRISATVTGKEKLRMAVVCRLLEGGARATERVYEVVPMSRWCEI